MALRPVIRVALALALAAPAVAQDASDDANATVEVASTPASADPQARQLNVELERERLRALIVRTKFAEQADTYEAHMYAHHQFWTDAAAIAVYIITFFGLFCAGVQFRLIDRLRGIDVHAEEGDAGMVELPGGAKISSPFLGIIILFISLAFFYLYLENVYPIVDVAELEAKRAKAETATH